MLKNKPIKKYGKMQTTMSVYREAEKGGGEVFGCSSLF